MQGGGRNRPPLPYFVEPVGGNALPSFFQTRISNFNTTDDLDSQVMIVLEGMSKFLEYLAWKDTSLE